jgi:hypothetical protein
MNIEEDLKWVKDDFSFVYKRRKYSLEHPILDVEELPHKNGVCVVVWPPDMEDKESNALIYSDTGSLIKKIEVKANPKYESDRFVRFIGVGIENNEFVIAGWNETLYVLDPNTYEVLSERYYR